MFIKLHTNAVLDIYSLERNFLIYIFFCNDTATTEIYTLSLHDALPITFFPLFKGLTHYVNPDLETFAEKNPITVSADQATCNFHIFVGPWSNFTECDRAQDFMTKSGLSFKIVSTPGSKSVDMSIGP